MTDRWLTPLALCILVGYLVMGDLINKVRDRHPQVECLIVKEKP